MKQLAVIFAFSFALILRLPAQQQPGASNQATNYRPSETKINDVVHTRLDLRFNIPKEVVYGKAWLTLRPHFYPTDSLRLDANGMHIHTVAIVSRGTINPLLFTYDSLSIFIKLGKLFRKDEQYLVY